MTRMSLRVAPLALVCLAITCGKSTVTVTQIAPGAQCPTGGISIVVDNGAAQIVCSGTNGTNGTNGSNGVDGGNGTNGTNGSNGFTTLVKTTTLLVGDANCAGGGQRIDSGLDNGANGGTANDGILQAGEITSTSYVCNGSAENVGSIVAPSGSAGDSTIAAVGGDSDAGAGGDGGVIFIGFENGTIGGHVKVFRTGAADPSFIFPEKPVVDLGETPANITADTTIDSLDPSSTDAGRGTLYVDGNNMIARLDDPEDGGSTEVTGISIAAGVTVFMTPAINATTTYFGVNGAIVNAGTITLANVGAAIALQINANAYFGDITSAILNNGIDGAALPPGRALQNAGASSNGSHSGGIVITASPIWNEGLLSAKGGNGASGGNGGGITLQGNRGAAAEMFNTGIIQATGGVGAHGAGGSGGDVHLAAYLDLNNSGPIDASGGAGTTAGGWAGQIGLYGGYGVSAALRNSGTLTAKGGDVAASCAQLNGISCAGGNGAEIDVQDWGGTLTNNAAISTRGGSSRGGRGGAGARVFVLVDAGENSPVTGNARLTAPGDLLFSGSIDSSGGFGGVNGGAAGPVQISFDNYYQPNGQEVILYGYAQLNSSGGTGATNGGNGAELDLVNTYYAPGICHECRALRSALVNGANNGPGGSVINYADLVARGGTGGTGIGGSGGLLNLSTQAQFYFGGDAFEQVINAGNIDVSGGASTVPGAESNGGDSSGVRFYGLTGVTNLGGITARGGASAGLNGGSVKGVWLGSDNGVVTNSNTIDVSGGASSWSNGGGAGTIVFAGTTAVDTGALIAAGGVSTAAECNGGTGGGVQITSTIGFSSVTVAAPAGISVAGGTALQSGTPGAAGQVNIDGWNLTSSWTH